MVVFYRLVAAGNSPARISSLELEFEGSELSALSVKPPVTGRPALQSWTPWAYLGLCVSEDPTFGGTVVNSDTDSGDGSPGGASTGRLLQRFKCHGVPGWRLQPLTRSTPLSLRFLRPRKPAKLLDVEVEEEGGLLVGSLPGFAEHWVEDGFVKVTAAAESLSLRVDSLKSAKTMDPNLGIVLQALYLAGGSSCATPALVARWLGERLRSEGRCRAAPHALVPFVCACLRGLEQYCDPEEYLASGHAKRALCGAPILGYWSPTQVREGAVDSLFKAVWGRAPFRLAGYDVVLVDVLVGPTEEDCVGPLAPGWGGDKGVFTVFEQLPGTAGGRAGVGAGGRVSGDADGGAGGGGSGGAGDYPDPCALSFGPSFKCREGGDELWTSWAAASDEPPKLVLAHKRDRRLVARRLDFIAVSAALCSVCGTLTTLRPGRCWLHAHKHDPSLFKDPQTDDVLFSSAPLL
jgi:hypothetical protein